MNSFPYTPDYHLVSARIIIVETGWISHISVAHLLSGTECPINFRERERRGGGEDGGEEECILGESKGS